MTTSACLKLDRKMTNDALVSFHDLGGHNGNGRFTLNKII